MGRAHVVVRARIRTIFFRLLLQDGLVRARIRTIFLRRLLQDGLGHEGEAWRCRERRRHLRLFGGRSAEHLDRNLERNLAALVEDLRAVREVRLNDVALAVPLEALCQALHACGDDDGVAPAAAVRPQGLVHEGMDHASSLRLHEIGKRISHVVLGTAVPRHVDVVERLLRHVAFQLGHEVAARELTRDVAEHECRRVSELLGRDLVGALRREG
mmetsp:Transcript_61075/g.164392  ORF Transcript_61075/g.164392 Transcript_61075/m.164392 type:complete len:214 (-) Transcript_61075:126-767(-)